MGVCSQNRPDYEQLYTLDVEDARRIFTAKGIEQEMKRRKSGSKGVYIGPPAHVNRIKWNLEHPNEPVTKAKSCLYRLLSGLPFSTRIYRHSDRYDSWELVSNTPISIL